MSKGTVPVIFYSVCLKLFSRRVAHTLLYGPGQMVDENLTGWCTVICTIL